MAYIRIHPDNEHKVEDIARHAKHVATVLNMTVKFTLKGVDCKCWPGSKIETIVENYYKQGGK